MTDEVQKARRSGCSGRSEELRRVPPQAARGEAEVRDPLRAFRSSASTRRRTSRGRRSRRSGFPGSIPTPAGLIPTMYRGRDLDHAADRRLRHRRGHQPPLPLPDRARPDRALGGLRHAHPDGLRLRRSALAGRSRARRRGRRHHRRHGGALRRHRPGEDLRLHDHQPHRLDPAGDVRGAGARSAAST